MTEKIGKVVALRDKSHVLLRPYHEGDLEELYKMFSTMSDANFRFQIRPTERLFNNGQETKTPCCL